MAASLLALIDDIATILDDVSVLAQVAAKKTASVLGDDLALNAQQVSGVQAERELPVVWAVAKGSFVNKAILVPLALAISAWAPWAVTPLLMVGGAYLCFEGFEKLFHTLVHRTASAAASALTDPGVDLMVLERDKIKGAIRTDFVLSAEIIVITLGTVAAAPLLSQLTVLAGIAVVMTAGVYGLVAAIVKLDDAGLFLARRPGAGAWPVAQRRLGVVLVLAAPRLMKALSVAGTAAMFLVGGGILSHGIAPLHHALQGLAQDLGGLAGSLLPWLLDSLVGVVAGGLVLAGVAAVRAIRR